MRIRRGHHFVGIGGKDSANEKTLVGLVRNDGVFVLVCARAEGALRLIESQFRFARAFVGAMTNEAAVGKQRTNIAIEPNFRAAERDGDY